MPTREVWDRYGTNAIAFALDRFDDVMVRFDRDGQYLDMLYPSAPANLAATGKTLSDVYEHFHVQLRKSD